MSTCVLTRRPIASRQRIHPAAISHPWRKPREQTVHCEPSDRLQMPSIRPSSRRWAPTWEVFLYAIENTHQPASHLSCEAVAIMHSRPNRVTDTHRIFADPGPIMPPSDRPRVRPADKERDAKCAVDGSRNICSGTYLRTRSDDDLYRCGR